MIIDGIYDHGSDDLLIKYSVCKVEECGLFVDIEKGDIKIMEIKVTESYIIYIYIYIRYMI